MTLTAKEKPEPADCLYANSSILFSALVELGDIWMMRKTLLNLPDRAEGHLSTGG